MMRKALIIFSVLSLGAMLLFARNNTTSRTSRALSLSKALTGPANRSMSNIGAWEYWIYDDGTSAIKPNGASGGVYPKGTAGTIFTDGLVWGGFVGDDVNPKVGGQTYETGTIGGWVETWGPGNTSPVAVSASDERVGIYRIRSDWRTLSAPQVALDVALLEGVTLGDVSEADAQSYMDEYAWNWKNWPTDLGAPYMDVNGNGSYDPVLDGDGYPIAADGDYPGIANADQVIWFVVNDLDASRTTFMYGSQPIGIELQITIWAYNQPGARLGQIVFKKFKFINVSGKPIRDMYVGQWSDPDLGNFADDVVGCDTLLSLGFAYNGFATDDDYDAFGLAPAAAGYDFFQGPIVVSPGDTAIFDLKPKPGYKNLPLTSFGWFAAGADIEDPDLGEYDGTLQWYNLLQGNLPENDLANPKFYHVGNDPDAPATKYPLSGDPVAGTGDLDGQGLNFPPGDRRMVVCSGPFYMAAGDTQEVVVAVVGGLGDNNLSSVADMKLTDAVAQTLYDDLFRSVPKAPASPKVTAAPFENSVVLNWGYDAATVKATEETVIADYAFEGYNVYQLPNATATKDQAELIATYDLVNGVLTIKGKRFLPQYGQEVVVPVQFGVDKGVQRSMSLDKDYITGLPLYNGTTYYYAVTAYNYNADPQLIEALALESPLIVSLVTIQGSVPGTVYEADVDDLLDITHSAGVGDGSAEAKVIDPSALTGHTYTVEFVEDAETGEVLWFVKDQTTGVIVTGNQEQISKIGASEDQPIFDGLKVAVSGPPTGINPLKYGVQYGEGSATSEAYLTGWDWSNGDRWIGGRAKGWIGLFGGLGNGADWWGTTLTSGADYYDVELLFAGCETCVEGESAADMMVKSKAENPDRWSKALSVDGWGAWGTTLADIPISAWDTESDPPRQLKIVFVEDSPGNMIWDMGWDGAAFAADGGYEYILILTDTYDTDYTDLLALGADPPLPILYTISPQARGSRPYLQNEFDMQIFASNVSLPGEDVFTFVASDVIVSADTAAMDVEKINVFPNPYYAHNPQEVNRFERFVTFNHLPPLSVSKTNIRIFNLSGVQVRKFEKDDESQFLKWDLQNELGLPVGSGIYIVHIDMPDLNKQKLLKLFIIQSKQILQYY